MDQPLPTPPSERLEAYLRRQRSFWNTKDEKTARFGRIVTTEKKDEAEWNASTAQAIELIFGRITPKETWTVLEIGCGVGRILSEVVAKKLAFRMLIGVDISETMIGFARKRIGETPRVRLFVNNGCNLKEIGDSSVDLVYSNDVFIHIFDLDVAMTYFREVRRVLTPNGLFRFNVRTFNPDTSFAGTFGGQVARLLYKAGIFSMARHRWNPRQDAEFNGNQYMPQELRRFVEKSGLKVEGLDLHGNHLWCTTRKKEV